MERAISSRTTGRRTHDRPEPLPALPQRGRQRSDRQDLELRPGLTTANVGRPKKNAGPDFIAASERLVQILAGLGLPAE